tara:strand:+ start:259 stop:393 length:135 start_codon:yes stop_codon:yes gene_type:complete
MQGSTNSVFEKFNTKRKPRDVNKKMKGKNKREHQQARMNKRTVS